MKKIKPNTRFYFATIGAIFGAHSSPCLAHNEQSILPSTALNVSASTTYRDSSPTEAGEPWLIPGVILGGEALPPQKGFSLDDISLLGHYNINNTYSVSAKISAHGHGNDNNIELENIWLTWDAKILRTHSYLEIGKITTQVSPSASYHASLSEFSESPVISDVFFGRHFNDMGIKLKFSQGIINAGVELWSGDTFPASGNEGAISAFFSIDPRWEKLQANLSAWTMNADALNRNDDRYGNGHSHGGINVESAASSVYFTGDTQMSGAHASLSYTFPWLKMNLETEFIQSSSDGTLKDDGSQTSLYDSHYEGFRNLVGLEIHNHTLNIQHEELSLDNTFLNAINLIFLNQTGLQNNGFNPGKLMVSWQWRFHPDFRFRWEYIQDSTISQDKLNRSAIGFIWHRRFI